MSSRLRVGPLCTVILSAWARVAAAQSEVQAPAAVPAPATAAAPAAAAPADPATTPAAAPPEVSAPAPSAAEPAWPESESECNDWAKNPPAAILPKLEAEVPHRYLARLIPVLGFAAGGGLGEGVGLGWRVGTHADIGVASPLWLSGSAYYARVGGKSTGQIDVLTGLNLVSWGTRWVKAGYAEAGGAVSAWNSHCQHRRNEFALLLGGKLIFNTQSITALQAGFGESFQREHGFSRWSLTGLFDPAHSSYGGQIDLGAGGGFLPYPVYLGTVIGAMTGDRKNWWGTIDVGAVLAL
jgi:hypothetical protein